MIKDSYNFIEGEILLLKKPLTWTSFDLVKKVRTLIQRKYNLKKFKVGHAGTLDPLATGLMVICTGKKTKEIADLQNDHKVYEAQIKLGVSTASYDLETEIEQEKSTQNITLETIKEAAKTFLGPQKQVPPIFSAKKISGERAYKKARRGEQVEMKSNDIEIFEFEISSYENNIIKCRIHCSKGTYIRSLAHDLGKKLNNLGTLVGLKRTRSGQFFIDQALSIEKLEELIKASANQPSIC
ncbi:MAG: tRNA pseudouridine(55) synthase TruB [Flavobacteriales bacterium]|nr:tRNA pseudouridine(55) synthase TruB [Flavobacteriales bacterium]